MVRKEDPAPAPKRPPGRPPAFDRAEALDRAVDLFWSDGYDGVDVERIAAAVGVTKPSLYRAFGDKKSLFMLAVQRYAQTYGALAWQAFADEPDIARAVAAFCRAAVETATLSDGRRGCLIGGSVVGRGEAVDEARAHFANGSGHFARRLADRFEAEVLAGRLAPSPAPIARARLLVDAMQGMCLRARAGVSRETLLAQVEDYARMLSA